MQAGATLRFLFVLLIGGSLFAQGPAPARLLVIAQISDTHLGEARAPHAAQNLRLAVQMINSHHVDAVVLTGDISESPQDWEAAKAILNNLSSPLYFVPGNHDVHTRGVNRYRAVFGDDYYSFILKNIDFLVIDSQLLGNYEQYGAMTPSTLPPETEQESRKMLQWLASQAVNERGRIVIGLQHIPPIRDGDFPPDTKPYWVISEPYRSSEVALLHYLGIKHMLVGHWHSGRVFQWEGITWHVGPSTSWLPWGEQLGFALHSITPDGNVKTDFVNLPNAQP
jgi:3',5'-cyclic AMP phosphodiesterase CpdA